MADTTTIPLPETLLDQAAAESAIVMHDDFRRIVSDTALSFNALQLVQRLLRDVPIESPVDDPGTSGALLVLLEGVQARLGFAVDGLVDTAGRLGLPDSTTDLRAGLM